MSGDYPTEAELRRVREWDAKPSYDFMPLMDFVKSIGHYWPDESWGWSRRGRSFYISTGGWSGNESIIYALMANQLFWTLSWVSSRVGGHYRFHIRKVPKAKEVTKK